MISNTKFRSEIDGRDLKSYKYKIDWSIKDFNERKKIINEILNLNEYGLSNDSFWQEVWDCGICKSVLNKTDTRWEETDVAKFLETIGTFLIYGYKKREKVNRDLEINENLSYDEVADDTNYRLAPPNKILQSDYKIRPLFNGTYEEYVEKVNKTPYEIKTKESFERIKHNEEEKVKLLKDAKYNLDILQSQMEKIKKGEVLQFNKQTELILPMNNIDIQLSKQLERYGLDNKNMIKIESKYSMLTRKTNVALYHLTDNFKTQKDYMILCKLAYTNRVMIKPNKCPIVKHALESIDYLNPSHVRGMLMLSERELDPSSDMSIIAFDINKKIKEMFSNGELSERDLCLIEGIQFNIPYRQLGEELDINFKNISATIDSISLRIARSFYDDFIDLLFLNKRKGKYKKCSRCGNIKLVREFDKNGKKGLMSMCKKCRKKI